MPQHYDYLLYKSGIIEYRIENTCECIKIRLYVLQEVRREKQNRLNPQATKYHRYMRTKVWAKIYLHRALTAASDSLRHTQKAHDE